MASKKDLAYIVVLGAAAVLLALSILNTAFGITFPLLVVKSGSMRPLIEVGDIIIVTPVNPAEIWADPVTGDVIIFYRPGYKGMQNIDNCPQGHRRYTDRLYNERRRKQRPRLLGPRPIRPHHRQVDRPLNPLMDRHRIPKPLPTRRNIPAAGPAACLHTHSRKHSINHQRY
jgi:signal peptidase I